MASENLGQVSISDLDCAGWVQTTKITAYTGGLHRPYGVFRHARDARALSSKAPSYPLYSSRARADRLRLAGARSPVRWYRLASGFRQKRSEADRARRLAHDLFEVVVAHDAAGPVARCARQNTKPGQQAEEKCHHKEDFHHLPDGERKSRPALCK
jgi:hypothetical protein